MNTASISELKKEIQQLPPERLVELCLRLVKYKKENKELLHYLLFEAQREDIYMKDIKESVEQQFADMNSSNIYLAKKSIRKILRMVNKYIKYSGLASTAIELLIHFCKQLNASGIDYKRSTALLNLYDNQLKKINKVLNGMHEDLQYDYKNEIAGLMHE